MGREKETEIFKKGIWIKEQQGVLTVGSLDKKYGCHGCAG